MARKVALARAVSVRLMNSRNVASHDMYTAVTICVPNDACAKGGRGYGARGRIFLEGVYYTVLVL